MGVSPSDLMRQVARRTSSSRTRATTLRALEASAGSWHDRDFTGSEYVDALRGDLRERLSRLELG